MPEFTSPPEKADNSHSYPLPTLQISKDDCNEWDRTDICATQRSSACKNFSEWLCTNRNITQKPVGGKALSSLVMNPCAKTDLLGTDQETLRAGSHLMFPVTWRRFFYFRSPGFQPLPLPCHPEHRFQQAQYGLPASWMAWGGGKPQCQAETDPTLKGGLLKSTAFTHLPTIRTSPLVSAVHILVSNIHPEKEIKQCQETIPGTETQ